jgi:hypothetical protein
MTRDPFLDLSPSNRPRFLPKRKRPWGTIATIGALVLGVAALAIYFAIWGFPTLEVPRTYEPPAVVPSHESKEFNYRFIFPDRVWKKDDQARLHVKANCLAMRRTNPDAWFALAARDFKTRNPEKEELVKEAVQRLGSYFKQFEWDPAPDSSLAGQPAWTLKFQGQADNTLMRGECYMIVHKTTAYWFTTWCAVKETSSLDSEWEKIRGNFILLDAKEN